MRLLEFSRCRPQGKHFAPRHEEEVGPGFFVTEDRGGIGYSSSWMNHGSFQYQLNTNNIFKKFYQKLILFGMEI